MTFDEVFRRVLGTEGGYVNDPNDPGGETKFGISKRSYPNVDIKALTVEQAQQIYGRDFWSVIEADGLPDSVAFQLFDFAVQSGVSTAIRYLQRALRVADDGHWGPVSRAAAAQTPACVLIPRLAAERLDFLTRLHIWQVDSAGLAHRIVKDLTYGADDLAADAPQGKS